MSLPVAAFSGGQLTGLHRRTIRSEVNPYDKATVFSIYPKSIPVCYVTVQPSDYLIPAGKDNAPGRLVVGPCSWWRDIDPEQPLLEIRVSALQVADSLVRDYCNARWGSNMGDSMPGLFYLPGEKTVEEMKKEAGHLLVTAIQKQRNWYRELVKQADSMWARANGNPLAIDDTARIAAHELGLERDWRSNYKATEMVKCVACGQLRDPLFPICSHCHAVIDKKKADELGLVFAK